MRQKALNLSWNEIREYAKNLYLQAKRIIKMILERIR